MKVFKKNGLLVVVSIFFIINAKADSGLADNNVRDMVLSSVCGLTPIEIKKFKEQKDKNPSTFKKEKKNYGKKVVDFLNGKALSFIKTYGNYVDMGINVLETTLKKTVKSLKDENSKDYKIFKTIMDMARSEVLLCKRLGDSQKTLKEETDKDTIAELKDSIADTKIEMTETALSLLDLI